MRLASPETSTIPAGSSAGTEPVQFEAQGCETNVSVDGKFTLSLQLHQGQKINITFSAVSTIQLLNCMGDTFTPGVLGRIAVIAEIEQAAKEGRA